VRRPVRTETTAAETPREEQETRSLSGDVVGARVSTVEWALYGAFFFIGLIMRLWDLGSRALHHDESLHATYSWYLWERLTGTNLSAAPEYHYDPMMHGPYQFHGNALMYLIFGPSDWSVRLNAALCGTALIALPFLLRRQLGRVSALALSGLLAFSPAFLYYSRFTREDIYFALWTMLFFVGFIRWLDARGGPGAQRWLLVAAAGFALSWATKESTAFVTTPIVLGFIIGVFVVGYAYQFLAPRRGTSRPAGKGGATQRAPEHPLVAALGEFARANVPPLLAAFRGTPARAWVSALGVMAVIILVLYWPIGDPWQWGFWPGAHTVPVTLTKPVTHTTTYNTDAFTGGIQYWLQQQNESRGGQPWYYYFLVIPLYEQVAVVFGAAALVYYFLRRRTLLSTVSGAAFLVFTALTLFTGGMPGLQKLAALLMIVSGAALFVARPRSILVNLLLWWTVTTWGLYTFAGEKMPWLTLHLLLPTMMLAALYIGHLFHTAPRLSKKWLLTAGLLAVTALVSFRSSVALAYVDGANPTEMLVYTQTAQDVPAVNTVIQHIPLMPITTGAQERVWVDNNDTWPWAWYLHGEPYSIGTSEADASSAAQQRYPTIFLSQENHDAMTRDGKLASFANYTGYEFKLRWWFPEEGYRAWETTGVRGFLGQALQPSSWGSLLNWWATRTPFAQTDFTSWTNVYPFYVYVRTDLVKPYITKYVGHGWDAARQRAAQAASGVAQAPLQNDVAAALTRPVAPSLTITGATLARPLGTLRDMAVDAAGNIYVADAGAQRVVKFDRLGRYVTAWGAPGTGPGQFSNLYAGVDPAGIVVGKNGDIYVSDWTRIQEFTLSGAFVRQFGAGNQGKVVTASSFYGPRQMAVAPNGNLYIADTGNKRIQVYSPTGTHLFNIGTGAQVAAQLTAPGSFDEPSGVAVDNKGIVYVADYWNKRVQRFTLDGKYLSSYPVAGWAAQDYQEPYLAVDNKGHLFATDAPVNSPHVNHVLELDATTGATIRALGSGAVGTAGALTQPSGVAIGPDGALYIADPGAVKLLKIQQ
jgi:uncharacterized protein (TIGR03663 family)